MINMKKALKFNASRYKKFKLKLPLGFICINKETTPNGKKPAVMVFIKNQILFKIKLNIHP